VPRNRETFCWNCWRDWDRLYLQLSPWEQEQFLDLYPRVNPMDFERGRCPFCGATYNEELDEWFDGLLFDDDALANDDRADWE
jgi:hypothetical protein